ncbi:MAG: hypothetical protein LBT09_08240 [Planctomycetaceae bacterium]|jgi:hypothetical protein|nr:hypothetical protein [Planctomycetaceae bacterium]
MTNERPDPKDIDWSQYNRFNCPIISYPFYPHDINEYPFVICSNLETAIIAINPTRGMIIHRDGSKSEPSNLQKLCDDIRLPDQDHEWANEILADLVKNNKLK